MALVPATTASEPAYVSGTSIQAALAQLGPEVSQTPDQKEQAKKLNQLLLQAWQGQSNTLQVSVKSETAMAANPGLVSPSTLQPTPAVAAATTGAPIPAAGYVRPPVPGPSAGAGDQAAGNRVLDKRRIQELVKEVDPLEQLDDDVEDLLMQLADDFIDNVVTASCQIARHRKANTVEAKDVQLHLERNWNMWIPGFGSEEVKPHKKAPSTEAHRQRMALIKKTLKKY